MRKTQPIRALLEMISNSQQYDKNDILSSLGLPATDLLECSERHIVFHIPTCPLAVEILVNLRLKLLFDGQKHPFAATGKVVALKKMENGAGLYRLQLRQYDMALWRKFLQAADGESLRIEKVFASMKGES